MIDMNASHQQGANVTSPVPSERVTPRELLLKKGVVSTVEKPGKYHLSQVMMSTLIVVQH